MKASAVVRLILFNVISSCLLHWASIKSSAAVPKKEKEVVISDDLRGPVDLTVCSQNLKNYGSLEDTRTKEIGITPNRFKEKEDDLVRRFISAHCDVIAVQELLGNNEEASLSALNRLGSKLTGASNRFFEARVGPPSEGKLGLGFLVAKDRARIVNLASYDKVELPKLSPNQKPRLFSRGPLELQLVAEALESGEPKAVTVVNFHFKSKRGQGDAAGLEYETYRMEMAEALRRIVERRLKQAFASGSTILLLAGDRNSNFDTASARILEGRITLASFQNNGPCRLVKRGVPFCTTNKSFPQRLFSALTGNPKTKNLPGTFVYEGEYSWLDDILLPAESLPYIWSSPTDQSEYMSGVVRLPDGPSDHALVYTRLNW